MTTTVPGPAGPPPPAASSPPPPPSVAAPPSEGPFTPDRPRASWWNRVLAVLLDSAVMANVAWFATGGAPSFAALPMWGTQDPPLAPEATWWTAGTLLVLVVLQAYTGMTPGKRVAGISVVDAGSGRPIGLPGTVLRFLAHLIDAIFMVGYLRAAWHPEGRTFADSLLGTVVVRTTRPVPHRWVAWVRRRRDARVPWLRWPSVVTGGVALVVCAAAAAASLVQGGGGGEVMSTEETSCTSDGPNVATALVGSSYRSTGETRLGVWRTADESWRVVVGWSTGLGADTADNPDAEPAEAALSVRSPAGESYASELDPIDGPTETDPLWWSMPDMVAATGLDVPQDVSGWEARATLRDADGSVLAECTTTVPPVGSDRARSGR
ncbi:hypothetical protein GCM10023216_23220 [Isoptericola chiayiensis]|uniref:RDD domain-containing protein n=1 Tax=Isoptericola chiayiensis TaxID=579446 RepID=A0ABP8YKJ3_9MICO|nr:RDD family protein [Isoptericola chiayiensis]NOW00549.1 putative RDD family membrane protein YckC [Isoptericola chiayiensis]